jgi:hypothetical protein
MNTEVANMETKGIASRLATSDLGVDELLQGDIKIPRALLLQKMSKLVDQEKGKAGEIRGSIEANLLGGTDKPFLFVPLYMYNTWAIHEVGQGNKFVRTEPRTAATDKLDWEFVENGKPYKRMKCINVYILAISELESGEVLPYQLLFRGMSFDAGKTLSSIIAKLLMFGQPIYNYVFSLQTVKQENDKGTFFVFDLTRALDKAGKKMSLSAEHKEIAAHWMSQVRSGRVQVDAADDEVVKEEDAPF